MMEKVSFPHSRVLIPSTVFKFFPPFSYERAWN
jgi:hypothetical protein